MRAPLPGQVRQLGWISFLADICSEMVYPVIPVFVRTVLGAPAATLGLIEGLAEGLVSLMKGWSGVHSDRTGRRIPFLNWGYGLSALGKPLLAVPLGWPMLLVGRLVDRFGKGIRTTARDALIADSVDRADLGRAFGFHRAMDTAGALAGVVVGCLLLLLLPGQYQLIFLLAAIPGAASLVLTFRLKEPKRVADLGVALAPSTPSLRQVMAGLPPAYWRAFWLSMLFALANSSDMFLMAKASDCGFSPWAVVAAYGAYNLVYALLSYPMGSLSDRIGRWPVVGGGWSFYALAYFGFAWVGPGQGGAVWGLFLLYGLYQAMAQGASKALVAQHSPATNRGAAMGIFYLASGFATIAGNLLTGLLWDHASSAAALSVAGGLASLAALLALGLSRFLPYREV